MNSATGQQKIDLMAATINALVAQRQEMQQHMMRMHEHGAALKGMCPGMMGGGMHHRQMGRGMMQNNQQQNQGGDMNDKSRTMEE